MKYLELNFTLQPCDEAASDVLAALLADAGGETFLPTEEGLKAYIQQDTFNEAALQEALSGFQDIFSETVLSYSCSEAPDENWNATWEAEHHFEPIALPDGQQLQIIPRQAFGSGEHATTRMILSLLGSEQLAPVLSGATVIDAGCGTGILGIAALKLGAAHVFAYDIDEWSVRNAEENYALNGVLSPAAAKIVLGDASVLCQAPQADILMANINRNILLNDMPAFVAAMKPTATLLLSGFYDADIESLVDRAESFGLTLQATRSDGDWRALLLRKQ